MGGGGGGSWHGHMITMSLSVVRNSSWGYRSVAAKPLLG